METDIRRCKSCGETKKRTLVGKFPDNVNKKYVDETGKLWSGSTCPSCHKTKCKVHIAIKRSHVV